MTTRMNPHDRLEVSHPDLVVVSSAPQLIGPPVVTERADDAAGEASTTPAPRRRRMRRWLLLVGVLVAAAVAALAVAMTGGEPPVVAEPRTQPRAAEPVPTSPVRVTVEAPATVVAGKPASFSVNYEADAARFSGTVEDWGDGLGTSSVAQGKCENATKSKGPIKGRYAVSHTWVDPGAYTVVLGVNAYSCVGTVSREVQGSRTITVNVVAP